MIAPKNAAPLPPSYLAMTGNIGTQTSGIEPISYIPTQPPVDPSPHDNLPPGWEGWIPPPHTPGDELPPNPGEPPDGTLPPPVAPPVWNPDVNSYIARLQDYLNSQREGWQQQYRGLGNTGTSWYDWANQQYNPLFSQWMHQNYRAPSGYQETEASSSGRIALNTAWEDWLKQNMVNYTNPIRLPQRNRMQVPVTDWTRLAGPDQGISSGFSERATASPWSADYRGGAYGATGRTPSWTQIGK
jgi:hypothetical protein